MSTTVTIAIGFGGTALFLLLSWWVWQRGRAAGRREVLAEGEQTTMIAPPPPPPHAPAADGTVAIPPPRDAEGTIAIPSRTAILPAPAASQARDEATQFIPSPAASDEATQFIPPPAASEGTQFMARMPSPASKPAVLAPAATETVSREEIEAVIAQHRRAAAGATPSVPEPTPAPTEFLPKAALPITEPTPAPTEFLPKAALPVVAEPTPTPASAIPKLEAPAPTPRSGPPDIPIEAMKEHFELALTQHAALASESQPRELAKRAEGPEQAWRRSVEVLALVAARSRDELVLPCLRDAKSNAARRRAAAALLLELDAKSPERLLEVHAELDAEGQAACRSALACWSSDKALGLALVGCKAASSSEQRLAWVEVIEARGEDPGSELVTTLLASAQPLELAAGLRLLCVHKDGQALAAKHVDRHMMMGAPATRMAALRAGLAYQRPAAWTTCKMAARDPALPDATLLFAMLAPASELDALVVWASKPSAPAHAGWALGLSGRKAGLEACIERLAHPDAAVAATALAGFRHASGYEGSDEPADVRQWWANNASRFVEGRFVAGQPLGRDSFRATYARVSRDSRAAMRLEMQVRSPAMSSLPIEAWPSRELALLEALAKRELDFDRGWGVK